MNPKNGQGEEKNALHHRVLLYEWVGIIQSIHPRQSTNNPYYTEFYQLTRLFDSSEMILLEELTHCITLLNKHGRTVSTGDLVSTRTDYLNAIHLLLPSHLHLSQKLIDFLEDLREEFKEEVFTFLEVSFKLRIPESTVKRKVKILEQLGFIESEKESRRGRKRFHISTIKEENISEEERSVFEQVHEDWKDFIGWQDFNQRT